MEPDLHTQGRFWTSPGQCFLQQGPLPCTLQAVHALCGMLHARCLGHMQVPQLHHCIAAQECMSSACIRGLWQFLLSGSRL